MAIEIIPHIIVNIWNGSEELKSSILPIATLPQEIEDFIRDSFWEGEVVGWEEKWVYRHEDISLVINDQGEEFTVSIRNSKTPLTDQVFRDIEEHFDIFNPIKFLRG